MQEIGVRDEFITSSKEIFEPYDSAIEALRNISLKMTPLEKTACLVAASTEIDNTVKVTQLEKGIRFDKQRGAEDLFPIFLHVFVKANIPNLFSEYRFMIDFMDESVLVGFSTIFSATSRLV